MSQSDDNINNIIKILFIITTFIVAIFFGYSPMMWDIKRRLKKILGLMNSLNGGILIGIGLFILLPHADKSFKQYFSQPADSMEDDIHSKWEEMPYAFYLAFASYALLLFIEKVAFTKMMIPQNPANMDDSQSFVSESINIEMNSDEEEEVIKDAISTKDLFDNNFQSNKSLILADELVGNVMNIQLNTLKLQKLHLSLNDEHINKLNITELYKPGEIDTSNLFTYIMLMSICVDGFFEGIAIGASNHIDQVLLIAFTILVNKMIIGLSLGISLKKANLEKNVFIKFIFIFALFTPFGIMSGMFISHILLIRGIMLSISAGCYIYVSTSVVVIEEFTIAKQRFIKYMFFILGGLLTACILLYTKL